MKYFIIKPKTSAVNSKLIEGIKRTDPVAVITDSLQDSDVVILQDGWTRSRYSILEYKEAERLNKDRRMGYLYLDEYQVHLNKGER